VKTIPDEMTLQVQPGPVVGPVLRRVVGLLAARADMPVDRVDEVIVIAESLGYAAASHAAEERLGVSLSDGDGSLRMEFGPLEPGTTDEALSSARDRSTNGDHAEVRSGERGDYLVLTVGATGS
jgi:hypothetical protein